MRQGLHTDIEGRKVAYDVAHDSIRQGFGMHADWLDRNFDKWVRSIIFPAKKRVYFRFFKPDGDYCFISESDRVRSFDSCFTAWEALIKAGYVKQSWLPLFAETDRVVTEGDIKL